MARNRIWTVGHSTRSLESFVELLRAHGIGTLVDVRQYPRSRRYPHFNSDALSETLAKNGIQYQHMKSLGGRRRPSPNSINLGWRSEQFRGYADYMQTPEFNSAIDELLRIARDSPTAIMCAEAVPWRCHRSLIADALIARGVEVLDILDTSPAKPHALTPFAVVADGQVTYPASHATGEANLFDT